MHVLNKSRGSEMHWVGGGVKVRKRDNNPHVMFKFICVSCSVFFSHCIDKKASYMSACLCSKQLSYQIKFFWIELNWFGSLVRPQRPRPSHQWTNKVSFQRVSFQYYSPELFYYLVFRNISLNSQEKFILFSVTFHLIFNGFLFTFLVF